MAAVAMINRAVKKRLRQSQCSVCNLKVAAAPSQCLAEVKAQAVEDA